MRSASQFAAACLSLPPVPHPKGFCATSAFCWLCGADTHGQGWPLRDAIAPTFTNHNQAKAPASDAVCWQCVAMSSKAVWEGFVAAHPEKGLKTGHAMSWRCYSQVFSPALHDCPTRERWRGWLLNPPEPPFLFVIATSGQKHLIFRATVAEDRGLFPVQFEEESILVSRARLAQVFEDFEALYALGFSKDSILSGEYHHKQLLTVGLAAWRPLESKLAEHRRLAPDLLRLVHFCAQKPGEGS